MSTALRIRFRLSLSLSLSRVHISFGFLFFGCNYIYFWGSPAFPSFRLDATAFFTRFFLIYFWLAPVFFFWQPSTFDFAATSVPGAQILCFGCVCRDRIRVSGDSWSRVAGRVRLINACIDGIRTHPSSWPTHTDTCVMQAVSLCFLFFLFRPSFLFLLFFLGKTQIKIAYYVKSGGGGIAAAAVVVVIIIVAGGGGARPKKSVQK